MYNLQLTLTSAPTKASRNNSLMTASQPVSDQNNTFFKLNSKLLLKPALASMKSEAKSVLGDGALKSHLFIWMCLKAIIIPKVSLRP